MRCDSRVSADGVLKSLGLVVVAIALVMTISCTNITTKPSQPAETQSTPTVPALPQDSMTLPPQAEPPPGSEAIPKPVGEQKQTAANAGEQVPMLEAAPAGSAVPPAVLSLPEPAAKPSTIEPTAPMDLDMLIKRLKETNAIGFFTKIALKDQVDDLLEKFRVLYEGRSNFSPAQLRQPFDLLIMKVLALLQDKDPKLARDILASREALWNILSDPTKFAQI